MSVSVFERAKVYFGALPTRQGILGRRLLGIQAPTDGDLADTLGRRLASELRPDGSAAGSALATIWRAHELMDLGLEPASPGLAGTLGWILGRQDAPGAYGEGCDKSRHARRACAHWVGGFFSPGPPSERLAPITLPNGKAFRTEPAARFAVSCLALRAVLRAGLAGRPAVKRHLESLRTLADQWTEWSGFFAPDVIVAGVHALARGGTDSRGAVERLVDVVATRQQADGEWPNADLFQTVDALVATSLPAARLAVRRAAPALERRQRADGSFGATAQAERALIAVRALVWAA
ncbi:MAG: hypothetical protein ACTHM9_06075 [Gemmatimonadales bacterium]